MVTVSKTLKQPLDAPDRPVQRLRWRTRHRHALEAWIILTPILIYYFIFSILPVLLNLFVSFTEWNGIFGLPVWVGFHNYLQYLQAPYPLIIFNTALFAFVILVVQTSLAFFIALLLNQNIVGRGIHRALWYIPTLTSAAVAAQIGTLFIAPYGGILNGMLKTVGVAPQIWPTSSLWMRIFIIVFSIWRGLGSPMVLFLAALQGIPQELYEAARVDGAVAWNILRYITIPLLKPMILFVVVTSIIGGFQIFEAVFIISKGGPFDQTNVMLVQIYNDAFANTDLGMASTGAMVMMIILIWFSITSLRLMRKG